MTQPKCKCHPDNPFLWRNTPRSSIFVLDKSIRHSQMSSASQTAVVDRKRLNGNDISHIAGISNKPSTSRIDVRHFAVYSRVVASKK